MKNLILLFLVCTIAVVTGCAGAKPLNTNSGRPEVSICGVQKAGLMEKVVASASMDGFNIRSSSNFQIVMGKVLTNNFSAGMLYGSKYDPWPEFRLIWTLADTGNNCIHVGVVLQMITNPGSAFEKVTDVSTGKDGYQMQEGLETIKARIEGTNFRSGDAGKQRRRAQSAQAAEKLKEAIKEDKVLAEKGDVEAQKRVTFYEERIRVLEAD